jgi:DNA-directed RNA polymerase specialized sigma24 family protein|tara:strand:+ start:1794 stop:2276 length:483 start_codon:yes stop_codon:yes gene_type:complete
MTHSRILIKIAQRHKDWKYIVQSFGCNSATAEDLVQEMYIKLQRKLDEGLDISYDDNFNYSYVFKTLRTLFLDLKRKENKVIIVNIEDVDIRTKEDDVDYDKAFEDVENEVGQLFWYDRKVYQIIDNGSSIAELSRKTKIPYYSLYNTFKKVKDKLKKVI